jgi:alpha-beta hydrolase superfamily lysophospholipase
MILYGQSMGSAAILRAVAVHPIQPAALVLECPFDRMLATVENRFDAMGLPAFPSARLLVFWGGVQHRFNGFQHNPVEYAQHVKAPVLLLHGENDPRVTRAQAKAVFESFDGPKELELFPDVGHESYLAANGAKWKATVSQFLGERIPKPER